MWKILASASVDVMSNQSLYFSGLIGNDTVIKVTNGTLTQIRQNFRTAPFAPYGYMRSDGNLIESSPIVQTVELDLNIIVGSGGYTLTRFEESLTQLPISDKRCGDCSIEELLYAVRCKLEKE